MKMLLDQFLELTGRNCQVVNIGAGFDTMFWRLHVSESKNKQILIFDFCL